MVEERVQKIISNCGHCSRRKAEELIEQGRVLVNSKPITLGTKADLDRDKIMVDGTLLKSTQKIYLMLHKPKGYVVTLSDPHAERTVMDLINEKERVYPVGRLDAMTSGLLLLTNDGEFSNRIMHPRYEKVKKYRVVLDTPLLPKHKEEIEAGMKLEEFSTSPCTIRQVKPNVLVMSIHEGKNRQIRRIFEHFAYEIKLLHRFAIGPLELDIENGTYRRLTPKEIAMLLASSKEQEHKGSRRSNYGSKSRARRPFRQGEKRNSPSGPRESSSSRSGPREERPSFRRDSSSSQRVREFSSSRSGSREDRPSYRRDSSSSGPRSYSQGSREFSSSRSGPREDRPSYRRDSSSSGPRSSQRSRDSSSSRSEPRARSSSPRSANRRERSGRR